MRSIMNKDRDRKEKKVKEESMVMDILDPKGPLVYLAHHSTSHNQEFSMEQKEKKVNVVMTVSKEKEDTRDLQVTSIYN